MTAYDELDHILGIIYSCNPKIGFTDIASKSELGLHKQNIFPILDRLERDGYIMCHPYTDNRENHHYSLTFDGRFFYQEGGYKAKHDSEIRAKCWEWIKIAAGVINALAVLYLTYLSIKK